MHIAFDLRRIGNPGIGRYMRSLVKAIVELGTDHSYLLIAPPGTEHLLPLRSSRCRVLLSRLKYYSVREQFALPLILRQHKVDLLHSPHFLIPLARRSPTVITIHDVIYLACPGDLDSRLGQTYYSFMIRAAARRASAIVTVSEYSKQDLLRHLGADPAKIHVVYSGVDDKFVEAGSPDRLASLRAQLGLRREFVLYAGIYKQRKNHSGLIRAFRELVSSGVDADLVIAGPLKAGEAELRSQAYRLGLTDRVVFTGFIEDADLPLLYSMARVYACPSLYEGFGFTILEAMASGVPVVSSPETSLPEVGGQAALYADARNPVDFAEALRRAFEDEDLRHQMIAAGYNNLQRFSWQEAARRVLSVYEQALAPS